ncbi:MAG: hypothetical protein ACREXJ_00245 [Gammaproteobacteria bacterium]
MLAVIALGLFVALCAALGGARLVAGRLHVQLGFPWLTFGLFAGVEACILIASVLG